MKKILKFILFIGLFTISFFGGNNVFADSCKVIKKNSGEITTFIGGNFNDSHFNDLSENMKNQTLNLLLDGILPIQLFSAFSDEFSCAGEEVSFILMSTDGSSETIVPYIFPSAITNESLEEKDVQINLSKLCDINGNCSFKFRIKGGNNILDSYTENSISGRQGLGTFHFKCIGEQCTKNIKIKIEKPSIGVTAESEAKNCHIEKNDIKFLNFSDNFVDGRTARLSLNLSNCRKPLDLIVWEDDGIASDNKVSIEKKNTTVSVLDIFPTEDNVIINFTLGGDECDDSTNPDCLFYVELKNNGISIVDTEDALDDYDSGNRWLTEKTFINKGVILADASENDNWKIISYEGMIYPEDLVEPENVSVEIPFDVNSPCADGDKYKDNCYEFLAPIPGIQYAIDKKGNYILDKNGNKTVDKNRYAVGKDGRIAIVNIQNYQLGEYINKLFQIAVAILGVISVIMIIIAGVQYMTEESIYGKSDAKNRIVGAVSGLILALGIYLILHTINPQLLEVNFGDGVDSVKIRVTGGDIKPKTYDPSIYTKEAVLSKMSTVGILCPASGGQSKIRDVALSFVGKSSYRLGGKMYNFNGPYSYPVETRKCEDGKLCKDYCPQNNVCVDCSGFIDSIYACVGSNILQKDTTSLFSSGGIKINSIDGTKVNKVELNIGDIIGHARNSSSGFGHVLMYIGNGELIEASSFGGVNGRKKNGGVKKSKLSDHNLLKEKIIKYSTLQS